MLNQCARFWALVEDLRLAFIDAASAAHRSVPWFVKVHRDAVAPVWDRGPRRRNERHKLNGIKRLSVHTQNLSDRVGQYNRHKPTSFRAQRTSSAAVDELDHSDLLCKARRVHSLSRFRYPEHDPDAEAPI